MTTQEHDNSSQIETETNLLCALMWSDARHPITSTTLRYLNADDFYSPLHGQLFEIIQDKHSAGQPFSPATVNASLGAAPEQTRATLSPLLVEVMTANVVLPEQAERYATTILGASYRRQFAAMAATLSHAAENAPEDKLFSIMVEHGKHQRAAQQRREGYLPAIEKAKLNAPTTHNAEIGATHTNAHQQGVNRVAPSARAPSTGLIDQLGMSASSAQIRPATPSYNVPPPSSNAFSSSPSSHFHDRGMSL